MPKTVTTVKTTGKKSTRKSTKKVSLDKKIKKVILAMADAKYFNQNNTSASSYTAAGIMYNISTIAQGVSDNQRIADEVRLTTLNLRFRINSGSTGTTPYIVRAILFMYKPMNSATAPAMQDVVLETLGQDYISSASFTDYKQKQVIHIIKDMFAVAIPQTNPVYANWRIPLKNIKQTYVGSFSTNQLYIMFIGQAAATNASVYYQVKLTYSDI